MSQIKELPLNITKLKDKIYELKGKTFLVPQIPIPDISGMVMTKRQIAKKMLLISAGTIDATGELINNTLNTTDQTINSFDMITGGDGQNNNSLSNKDIQFSLNASQMIGQSVTPESAHFIIYGKFKRDENGNLIDNEVLDPDCVFTKLSMPDTHPNLVEIGSIIEKTTKALKMLGFKQQELLDDIAQTAISIPASVVAIASSAAILPPGAGIPTAFSAFQSLVTNLMNIVSKISGIANDIETLNYLPIIIEAKKLDNIIGIVNGMINSIIVILDTIDAITKIIPRVPSPPGLGNNPPEPVELEVSATPSEKIRGAPIKINLKANATKGSWEYEYIWTGPNSFNANGKEVIIENGPYETSEYFCKVIDKKNESNSKISSVIVNILD